MTPSAFHDFCTALVRTSASLVDKIITTNLRTSLSSDLNGSDIIIIKVLRVFHKFVKVKYSNLQKILRGKSTECIQIPQTEYVRAYGDIFNSYRLCEIRRHQVLTKFNTAANLTSSIFNSILPTLRNAKRVCETTTTQANPPSPPIPVALLQLFTDTVGSYYDRIMTAFPPFRPIPMSLDEFHLEFVRDMNV